MSDSQIQEFSSGPYEIHNQFLYCDGGDGVPYIEWWGDNEPEWQISADVDTDTTAQVFDRARKFGLSPHDASRVISFFQQVQAEEAV